MVNATTTVRELIDRAAEQQPDKTLFIVPETGQQTNYQQLQLRCVELQERFWEHGLRLGDFIALLGENNRVLAEHILASMYAGLIPVPLNPLSTPPQLSNFLDHCKARAIYASDDRLGQARAAAAGSAHPVRLKLLEGVDDACLPQPKNGAPRGQIPAKDDAGLLIYTSGTVDRPKGAVFTHANLVACAANTRRSQALTETDRVLNVLPFCHMNAVDKMLGMISVGGSIVLAPRFQLDRFWPWVVEYRCTTSSLAPSMIAQLLSREGPDPKTLATVRYIRSSSAPLPAAHRELFEKKFGILIREGMGMSEAGSVFMNPPPPGVAKAGSVGIASGFEVRILDPERQPLPNGQPGSIWLHGPAIMQGYHADPELTAKTLAPDRWLDSGDVGFLDDDGYVFLTGRTKEIIIKSGVNIAPAEIDAVLSIHPTVQEVATVGVPDSILGEDIVAYVVPRPGTRCEPDELIEVCRNQLGTLKTPRKIYLVDDLPRGPSGKVQRLKLAATTLEKLQENKSNNGPQAISGNGNSDAAAAASMARISKLWVEVLKRKDIKSDDDFFAIGGTSLLATELLMRMEREFSVELSLEKLLFHPTVAAQAKLLDHAVSEVRRAFLLAPVREGCRQPPLFCIHGVALYRALAVALGPDQPTYGLSPNLVIDLRTGERTGHFTLEQIAERYLEAVREVQSHGPYYLAGFSFGGRVALEIARRLREASEEVAMLSVIDTYLCCTGWRYKLHWLTYHAKELVRNGPGYLVGLFRHAQKLRRPEVRATRVEAEIRREARKDYRAKPYPDDITLFRAIIRYGPAYSMDEFLGWREVTQGTLDVHEVPGDHYTMMNPPNVAVLAEKLRAYLPATVDRTLRAGQFVTLMLAAAV